MFLLVINEFWGSIGLDFEVFLFVGSGFFLDWEKSFG